VPGATTLAISADFVRRASLSASTCRPPSSTDALRADPGVFGRVASDPTLSRTVSAAVTGQVS
jgi:hypothetical protein